MPGKPGFITVEIVMFFGLGFLLAMLMMLAFMPAVHRRAVRLTRRKYDVVPPTMREMQIEKDRLRADFAMTTRKLEHDIDKMQHKTAAHFTDLARKADAVTQLKDTLDARDTLIAQLQTQTARMTAADQNTGGELHAVRIENAAKALALQEANQRIAALMSEITALTAALNRRIHVYDTQQHEIMALSNQSDLLRMQLAALEQPAHQPSPGIVPAAGYSETHPAKINSPKMNGAPIKGADIDGEADVIQRALEAIQASGHGWTGTSSNGAVPFGH